MIRRTILLATIPVLLVAGSGGAALMMQEMYYMEQSTIEPVDYDHPSFDRAHQLYTTPEGSSGGGGGDTREFAIYRTDHPQFEEAFPSYELLAVYDINWYPWTPHLMAWDADDEEGFDLTMNYTALLEDKGVTMLTEAKAETYASAHMVAMNAELMRNRTILDSSDDDTFPNHTIEDMDTVNNVVGWTITADVWSKANGILAEATVEMTNTGLEESSLSIEAKATGPYAENHGDQVLEPGDEIVNDYAGGYQRQATDAAGTDLLYRRDVVGTSYAEVANRTAFDGTKWVARAPDADPETPTVEVNLTDNERDLAESLVEAGVEVYDQMIHRNHDPSPGCESQDNPDPDWGFHVNTTSCTVDVILQLDPTGADLRLCSACAGYPNEAACMADLYFEDDYAEDTNAEKYERHISVKNITTSIVAHEFSHVLQCQTIYDSVEDPELPILRPKWGVLWESQARFVETLVSPDTEFDKESRFYQSSNGVPLSPWDRMCSESYNHGVLWKYAAIHNTNTSMPVEVRSGQFLQHVLENATALGAGPVTNVECDEEIPTFVNTVLNNTTHATHGSFAEIWQNLSLDYLDRTNLSWTASDGTQWDWAGNLSHVNTETVEKEAFGGADTVTLVPGDAAGLAYKQPGSWGTHYFELNTSSLNGTVTSGRLDVSCEQISGPTDGMWMRIVWFDTDNATAGDDDLDHHRKTVACSSTSTMIDLEAIANGSSPWEQLVVLGHANQAEPVGKDLKYNVTLAKVS